MKTILIAVTAALLLAGCADEVGGANTEPSNDLQTEAEHLEEVLGFKESQIANLKAGLKDARE